MIQSLRGGKPGWLIVGLIFAAIFVMGAALADVLPRFSPNTPDYGSILQPPSSIHWFGTDQLGRDLFSRILHGARLSLISAALATMLGSILGVTAGLIIGFVGGRVDAVVSRVVDALFAFPGVLIALLVTTALGTGQESVIVAIGVISVPTFVRVTRSAVLAERESEYVAASRVLGSSTAYIIGRSILPNILGLVAVLLSVGFAYAILNEAALSFLGLGARPPTPVLGVMLSEGRRYLEEAPWYSFVPGLAIFLAVFGLNLLGDGFQGLLNPRRAAVPRTKLMSATTVGTVMSGRAEVGTPVPGARAVDSDRAMSIRELTVAYGAGAGRIMGAQRVSLDLHRGRMTALVGESGSGKSSVALAAAGLIEAPGWIETGTIIVGDIDLATASPEEVRMVRGSRVSMVFQDAISSLNPSMTIGAQMHEIFEAHTRLGRKAVRDRCLTLLGEVGIPGPDTAIKLYPHELSGGMRQRVMIAMAIALEPDVLIADEPTTALDVTVQARILRLIDDLRRRHGLAVLLVTHDLRVASLADSIAVMYATEIVEYGPAKEVLSGPAHPYTRSLISAIPHGHWLQGKLGAIPGYPPRLRALPDSCTYRDRCPAAFAACAVHPSLAFRRVTTASRLTRCHLYDPIDV